MRNLLKFCFALLLAVAACGRSDGDADATPPASGPVYLDVRTPEEFAAGHVRGTLHIPVEEIEQRWTELEPYRERDMIVYCRTGRRSAAAIEVLEANGFKRLRNGGGLDSLAAQGVAVEHPGN